MPRTARTRFVRKKKQGVTAAMPLQCCVVCYSTFHPYPIAPSRWASSMTKVFYKALNIPPLQTGGDDEGDEDDTLLPYCPECHSKMSLMFSLYSQLEIIQNQYACIRNEIAFIVVETIDRNCRDGPMDYIRQQIYEKWQEYHAEESAKENYRDAIGLDAILALNYFGMNDITNNFSTDDDDDVKSENGDGINPVGRKKNVDVPGSVEDLESVVNMMEVGYNENSGYDGNNLPLAPNAVHIIPKRHSKRTSTVVSTASLLAHDEQNLAMYENSYDHDQDLVNDGQGISHAPNGSNNVRRPGRGRPLSAKHNMPRLLPMNSGSGRKLAQASLAENLALKQDHILDHDQDEHQVNNTNAGTGVYLKVTRGRGRGRPARGFKSSRFVSQRSQSAAYNNYNNTDNNVAEHHGDDVYDFNLNGDPKPFSRANQRGLPRLLSMPQRGRPRGKASEYPNLKPMLRYPKRNSARPQRIKSEYIEMSELPEDRIGANELNPVGTEGVYACVLCPKFYTNPGRLLRHESLCHPSLKSIHCDVCGKGFSSRLTLRRHMTNLHPGVDDGTLKCQVCGKSFDKQYSLNLHMKCHKVNQVKGKRVSNRKQSPASVPQSPPALIPAVASTRSPRKNASKDSSIPMNMSNGELSEGSSPEKNRNPDLEANDYESNGNNASYGNASDNDSSSLTCGICQKTFPYRTLLNMHFITHAARKSYKCDSCNITFATYSEIRSHNDEVHRSKPLPCSVCGQEFLGADSLQRHLKVHDIKQERQEVTESHESEN